MATSARTVAYMAQCLHSCLHSNVFQWSMPRPAKRPLPTVAHWFNACFSLCFLHLQHFIVLCSFSHTSQRISSRDDSVGASNKPYCRQTAPFSFRSGQGCHQSHSSRLTMPDSICGILGHLDWQKSTLSHATSSSAATLSDLAQRRSFSAVDLGLQISTIKPSSALSDEVPSTYVNLASTLKRAQPQFSHIEEPSRLHAAG